MREWRSFVPALVMLAGSALVGNARNQEVVRLSRPLREVPFVMAGFSMEGRDISTNEQQVAGMSDYVFCIFGEQGADASMAQAFSVYVGYYDSQVTGRTIHSPRNRLPGVGSQTVESGTRSVQVEGQPVVVNRHILANGPVQALVYYWYQGRGRVAWNEYRVKWDLLRDAATRGRTEEALVRIMVPIPSSQGFNASDWQERQARADDLASRVAEGLVPTVERALPGCTGSQT